jgi:hypothetical protein
MAKKGVSVGVEITGSAKGYKSAAEDAKRATSELRRNAIQNSREIERNFKAVSMSVAKIGAAIFALKTSFDLFKKFISVSDVASDKLEKTLAGLKETANTLAQNLINADFSVSLNDAREAAEKFAEVLDDIGNRQRSLDIISAKNSAEVARLKGKLKDTQLTEEKRLEISKRIQEIAEDELNLRKQIAEEALGGLIEKSQIKYKIDLASAQLLQTYVEEYARFDRQQQESLVAAMEAQRKYDTWIQNNSENIKKGIYSFEKMKQLQNDITDATSLVPDALRKYIPLWRLINDLTDDQRDQIKNIIVEWYNANAAINTYLTTAERYENKLNAKGRAAINIPRVSSPGIGSLSSGIPSLPGLQQSTLKSGIDQTNESLITQIDYVGKLQSTFEAMFINVGGGFKGMVKSLIDSLKLLIAELVAKAAIFTVLRYLFPEVAIGMELYKKGAFGRFMGLADGGIVSKPTLAMIGEGREPEAVVPLSKLGSFGNKSGRIKIDLNGKLIGRDIYLSAVRYAELLNDNT